MSDLTTLEAAIETARADPALGRSALLRRLFDYLAASSLDHRSPKETEVAIEVFGRRPDFDASRDAVARVYVHKLRKRLEEIGGEGPSGLTIPRGEYRLVLRDKIPVLIEPPPRRRLTLSRAWLTAVLAAIVFTFAGWTVWASATDPAAPARNAVWKPLIQNGRPTIIALGDYYIFAETDAAGGPGRLVREYEVNSGADFDRFVMQNPDRAARYMDLGLSYLPVGSASGLMSATRALAGASDVRTLPVSSLTPAMLRDSNVVYVGYLSGLGLLRDATFAASRYRIGETYDEIIDSRTQERFASGGGTPRPGGAVYADYGYLATFAGPHGNRFVIIAGTRDAALMQMAQTAISRPALDALRRAAGRGGAAEALFGIDGIDQINLGDRLIRATPLDQSAIWRDTAGAPRNFPAG